MASKSFRWQVAFPEGDLLCVIWDVAETKANAKKIKFSNTFYHEHDGGLLDVAPRSELRRRLTEAESWEQVVYQR